MRINKPEAIVHKRASAPPESVTIDALLLSQSGGIATAKDGERQRPLVPGMAGQLTELVVIGKSPAGTRFENRFPIDDQGMLQWKSAQPLGHVPYQLQITAKDGSTYTADVDISPSKTGVSHAGYEELKGLRFQKQAPPPPPAPAQLKVPALLLSQSGGIATAKDGEKQKPLVPGFGGVKELVVTGLSPSGTRFENTFPIDDAGMLQWRSPRPLGHVPYRLTLMGDDGARWQTDVDITPSKTKVSHAGFEQLKDLVFQRVEARDDQGAFGGTGSASASDLANGRGAVVEKPSIATSPVGVFFGHKK